MVFKAKLTRNTNGEYALTEIEGALLLGFSPNSGLSKQNCDELFGVVDIKKIASDLFFTVGKDGIVDQDSYLKGFDKCVELNKDKEFTLADMHMAIEYAWAKAISQNKTTIVEIVRKRHTEIEVVFDHDDVDEDGYLILTRVR